MVLKEVNSIVTEPYMVQCKFVAPFLSDLLVPQGRTISRPAGAGVLSWGVFKMGS
jgi:hypothetical protein